MQRSRAEVAWLLLLVSNGDFRVSGHEAVGTENLLDFFQSIAHLLVGVRCHEAETDERVVGRYSRRNDGIDEDALIQQVARDSEGLVVVTDEQGDDGRLGVADLASHVTETLQCLVSDFPEVLLTLGLGNHDVDGLHCSCCRSRRDAGGEDVAAGMMAQVVGDDLAGGDETAQRSD